MPNSTIIIDGYLNSYQHLNGTHPFRISKTDIARGLLSIGKTHWLQHVKRPDRVILDFVHNWTGLQSYLREFPRLHITQRYLDLDGTEKMAKSYQIGMGVAKIVAERKLGIPYLQHVDSLVRTGIVTLTTGTNERGDLVGLDRTNLWHVLEAKGRTSKPTNEDKRKAKSQAERITAINGIAPATKSYCITSLSSHGTEILLSDPDELPALPSQLEIDRDNFIKFYYDKVFRSFYNQDPVNTVVFDRYEIRFQLFDLENSSYFLGLPDYFLKDLASGKTNFLERTDEGRQVFDQFPFLGFSGLSIGSDGIMLMRKDFLSNPNLIDLTKRRLGDGTIRILPHKVDE